MTELPERWITDTEISPRFPYYTRANADEVGPEPFSPLGWSLGWGRGCVPGVADGFVSFGVVTLDEFALDPPEVFGNWGGYFYNQLSLPRVMGVRMPGATPEAIDQAYFGDHPGVPPYTPHPDDDNAEQAAKLEQTMGWVMSTDGHPTMEEWKGKAIALRQARPDLSSLSDAELVERARAVAADVHQAWVPYCEICLGASLGPGAVQMVCGAIGRPEAAVQLLAAIGGVDSAAASFAMWELSRMVRGSDELTAAFDAGVDGLLERLEASGAADAVAFRSAFDKLIAEFGHRGPNEWDLGAPSWETTPSIPLGMLERLRFQSDDRAPADSTAATVAERERLLAEISEVVAEDAEALGALQAGSNSAAVFFQLRERGKNTVIMLLNEAKLTLLELGDRMVERGAIDDRWKVFQLLDGELDDFIAEPTKMTETLAERAAVFAELPNRVPPYIIKLEEGVPPLHDWPVRGESDAAVATAGEVLTGAAASPGTVTGTARIVLDPFDATALQPGDIMIAPTTDPSWTPLFLQAGAVVCNVGAIASHAAIVSRELGVPCVVSVIEATDRIPDGATITVDGAAGTVTIV
ncbi:MAG: PEP-utilizing enzyme [Actinomycetota bacterium]